jgi:hypothetical protein
LPPLTIPESDRHGALGSALADDVLVKLADNFARRQLVERELLFFGGCGKIDGHGKMSAESFR